MLLDLNDPESIFAWWQVWPERHDSYLDYKMKVSPEFAASIRQAQRMIAARPELRALRARLVPMQWERPQADAEESRPSYKELLAA